MLTFLGICLLAPFIAAEESFQCERCAGIGQVCEGPLIDCHLGEGTCGIMQIISTGVAENEFIVKNCLHSSQCNKPVRSFDFGVTGQLSVKSTCCKGNKCKVIPPLPDINTTPNGRKCPACYSVNKTDCKGVVAECTGDSIYCAHLRVNTDYGLTNMNFVLKGCTNYDICKDPLLGFSLDTFAFDHCVIASGAPFTIPGSLVLFLQILSGCLLLKILL